MKTFTNYTAGARGINVKGKGTVWIEPGKSVQVDEKTIVGAVPDLGRKPAAAAEVDEDAVSALTAENAELKKQVADLTKERDALLKKSQPPA